MSKLINKLPIFVLLFLMLTGVITLYNLVERKNERALATLETSMIKISEKANNLTMSVRHIENIVERLAKDIEEGSLSVEEINLRLSSDLKRNNWMYGLGVAFEPYAVSPDKKLFSKYYIVESDNHVKEVEIKYDYTLFKHSWYRKPLLEGNYWNEPYFGEASQALIAEYGVPFWLPGKKKGVDEPSGIIFGNISLHKLKKLARFDHNYIAYYYVLSKAGRYIVHADEALVLSGETIFERAWKKEDTVLNSMAVKAVNGEQGFISHIDPVTQDHSWMVYEPMKGLDWSLIVVIDKNRLLDHDEMRRYWFLFVTLVAVCAVLLTVLISIHQPRLKKYVLSSSFFIAVLLSLGVAALWKVAEIYPKQTNNDELKVMSQNILSNFKSNQEQTAKDLHMKRPKFIETGVYLQSVEFEGANNVKISGYVWHHYKKGDHKGISRGFVLPEAETPTINEVYREYSEPLDPDCTDPNIVIRDCDELVGWYIFATLRQQFDYSLYPLDSQQVWLRMWHADFRENIVLVPDINSYSLPNPKLTPGVQNEFVLPGWDIEESWFSFASQPFNTNFGSNSASGLQNKPELLYNLSIRRKFMDPFVSRIIPVMVIFILMFLFILICTKSGKIAEWLGFSASDVVLGLSALFFVIGINHSELRQSLQSSNIMYFEYFYFISYIMILYVAVSSIFIAKREVIEGIDENFTAKILYWPALSLVLYIVTFLVFF